MRQTARSNAMLIIHGRHRFRPNRIAYRNDYCLSCESETIAEQWRSFDFIHVFWIPLIPLGHRLRWTCVVCGNDPRERVKTSKFILFVAAGLLAFFAVVFLLLPTESNDEAVGRYIVVGIMALAFLWLVRMIVRYSPPPDPRSELSRIQPWTDTNCLYCNGRLWHDGVAWRCQKCRVCRFESIDQLRNP